CGSIAWYGERVRTLDDAYYRLAFAPDPAIAGCVAARAHEDGEPRSLTTGLAWSAIPTVVSTAAIVEGFHAANQHQAFGSPMLVIGAVGLLAGPSFGHAYAGHAWSFGLAIRLVGVGAGIGMVALGASAGGEGALGGFGGGLGLGGAIVAAGALIDVATAPSAVAEHNERLRMQVVPTVVPTTSGVAPGVGLSGRF